MRQAYSYTRFSTSPERLKGDNLRRQMAACLEYCKRHELHLDESLTMKDFGISAFRGKNTAEEHLSRFFEAVSTGRVAKGSVLIIESLGRVTAGQFVNALSHLISILFTGVHIVTLCPEREYSESSNNDIEGLVELLLMKIMEKK